MRTSSFCGITFEVLTDSTVKMSLETASTDLSIYMSHEEFLMLLMEQSNILKESKKLAKKRKQDRELEKEQRR